MGWLVRFFAVAYGASPDGVKKLHAKPAQLGNDGRVVYRPRSK